MRSIIGRLTLPGFLAVLAGCQTERAQLPSCPEPGGRILALAFDADWTPWSAPVRLDAPVNDPLANDRRRERHLDGDAHAQRAPSRRSE